MIQKQLTGSPAGEVLTLLQRKGAATVKELEDALAVTATAVRQQLNVLLAEGFIEQRAENVGRGPAEARLFADRQGPRALPAPLRRVHQLAAARDPPGRGSRQGGGVAGRAWRKRMAEQYSQQIAARLPQERAQALTELLNAKGIMAEVQFEPDGIVFREYTCPYYELAREHRAICDMEQDMIEHVMNQPVELVSCTLDGHHGCQFKIESK